MNLFKYKLIDNSLKLQVLFISRRYKSKKSLKFRQKDEAPYPCQLALSHFDDFYKSIFKEKWPSVRLGLLSKQKYLAVINNFGDVEETERILQNEGAFDLKYYLEIQKNYSEKSKSKKEENESCLSDAIQRQLLEKQEKDSLSLHPEGLEFQSKVDEYNEKKNDNELLYKPEDARSALEVDMKEAQIDTSRLIIPGLGSDSNLLEFVPATKLRGADEYITESEYYKYYNVKSEKIVKLEEEHEFEFPNHLKVYTFDRGEVSDFPDPSKNVSDTYNYLKIDGADLLAALALGVKPKDSVLDLCSQSENILFCLLQTFFPRHLVCTNDFKGNTFNFFSQYLHENSSVWKDVLYISSSSFDEIENESLFDKVLVNVPSTYDKISLFEEDNNIFRKANIRKRLKLPTIQCSLLLKGMKLVRPGGSVLYTTSTLSPVQNEGVVTEALRQMVEGNGVQFTVKDLSPALQHTSCFFNFGDYLNMKYGTLIVPFLPVNFGPRYICKMAQITRTVAMVASDFPETELEGEYVPLPPYPKPVDIDDGIPRDIVITQEIFGVITQYGTDFEVMRFTIHNTLKDGIKVQVMSLGAALVGVIAPDRKGVYADVVLGFDSVQNYYSPLNPGFGRITSLCPLPYNLEKVVWDWDFDRDEGSVTFSTTFYRIDLILSVKYTLNECNEIIVDLKACGSKIVPISLTSQVYWNMAGHYKGEPALKHHALSINSDRIWKHLNHKLKNYFAIHDTVLDFRQPTLMDSTEIFGEKKFEHVYVVSKGCKQSVSFVARLIHPRSCRYVEIFSDQPWILCNTLNKFPRRDWNLDPCPDDDDEDVGECSEYTSDLDPCASDDEKAREEELMKELDEIPGKEGKMYRKYGAFCVTPLSDLTGYDPILRAGAQYSHRIIYKVGVYRRYMKRGKKQKEFEGEAEEEGEVEGDDIVDINRE